MKIHDEEFARIRRLVYRYFGIRISPEKRSLVVDRLQGLLKKKGITSFNRYMDQVESDSTGSELIAMIDSLSTNHTFFFRGREQFDYFMTVILPGIETRSKKDRIHSLRVWSAGCSGGDEAYSLVICLLEYFGETYKNWNAGVLATDISEKMLEEGRQGIYSIKRLDRMPRIYVNKYFIKSGRDIYEAGDSLKREITFRRLNLKNKLFPFKRQFDLISCRNVMIYFDQAMKDHLIGQMYALTRPGGHLFIGSSESLDRRKTPYNYIMPGIYRKEE